MCVFCELITCARVHLRFGGFLPHCYSNTIAVFFSLHFLWLLTVIRNCLHSFRKKRKKYVKSISNFNNLRAHECQINTRSIHLFLSLFALSLIYIYIFFLQSSSLFVCFFLRLTQFTTLHCSQIKLTVNLLSSV